MQPEYNGYQGFIQKSNVCQQGKVDRKHSDKLNPSFYTFSLVHHILSSQDLPFPFPLLLEGHTHGDTQGRGTQGTVVAW